MRRVLIVILLLAVVAAGVYFYLQSTGQLGQVLPGAAQPQAEPTPLPAVQAGGEVVVDAVVVPVQYAALSMAAGGIVAEVLVQEGEQVEAGQVLARLDNERQVIAIAQAEARVRAAQAQLDELRAGAREEEIAQAQAAVDLAEANLQQIQEGARQEDIAAAQAAVAQAQAGLDGVLAGADEQQLVAAEAEMRNAEAAVRQAQNAYNDIKWMANAGAMPQSAALEQATNAYEAARASYDLLAKGADDDQIAAAQAQVRQAQAQLDRVRNGATESEIAAAQAQVRQAEASLALAQAGARPETIMGAEANLTTAMTDLMQRQTDLADTELTAPFAGTVASLSLRVGEQVAAGVPSVQLADTSEWRIETDDLTEINVVDVQEGDHVLVTVDALPDVELTGTVIAVKPLGENKQGDITYTATIRLDESDPRLRWNMTASVVIQPSEE